MNLNFHYSLDLWLQERDIVLEESFTSALRHLAAEYKKTSNKNLE